MARVRAVEGTRVLPVSEGWQVASAPAGAIAHPSGLEGLAAASLEWCPATVPATAASALRAAGKWQIDDRRDFDATDWWWRGRLPTEPAPGGAARWLRLGGLATLAEVWVDGRSVLSSRNMFVEHELPLASGAEIVVCCRSIAAALKARRPRPRWRTRLVEAQQLRWIRTCLLGRVPTWMPAAAPVGPWRAIWLEDRSALSVGRVEVRARVEGEAGVVDVEVVLDGAASRPDRVTLRLGSAGPVALACREVEDSGGSLARPSSVLARGTARIEDAALWWPHTHGAAERHALSLDVGVGGRSVAVDLGKVGFRTIEVDRSGEGFALRVNGVPIFCRRACWTALHAASLSGPAHLYPP